MLQQGLCQAERYFISLSPRLSSLELLLGQIKGDGEPSCFSNVDDTGVPALQEWCHQLTLSSRQRSARAFFAHLRTFATTVETYVRGIGDVTEADRAALREKWSSSGYSAGNDPHTWNADEDDPFAATLGGQPLYSMPQSDVHGNLHGLAPRLAKVSNFDLSHIQVLISAQSFSVVVDKSVEELQNLFKEGLEAKCHAGAASVRSLPSKMLSLTLRAGGGKCPRHFGLVRIVDALGKLPC